MTHSITSKRTHHEVDFPEQPAKFIKTKPVTHIPKLYEIARIPYLKTLTETRLDDRIIAIYRTDLSQPIKIDLTLWEIEQQLNKVQSKEILLSIFKVIEVQCRKKEGEQDQPTFCLDTFQIHFQSMIERASAEKKDTIFFQDLETIILKNPDNPGLSRMLGLWYACEIQTVEILSSFSENQYHVTKMIASDRRLGTEGANIIGTILKTNQTLKRINLRFYKLTDEGVIAIAQALKVNRTLTHLNLSLNIIEDGAVALADALKVNTSLVSLDLGDNPISTNGIIEIAEALKVNRTLKKLDLRHNYIADNGAIALAEALKVNTTLTKLNLCRNDIKNLGAISIARSLHDNKSLVDLDLATNEFNSDSANVFAEMLTINRTLTVLNIAENEINGAGIQAIVHSFLIDNSTLTTLHVEDNVLEEEDYTALTNLQDMHPNKTFYFEPQIDPDVIVD